MGSGAKPGEGGEREIPERVAPLDPRIPEALAHPDAFPDAFPDAGASVAVVQTNLSYVFLTRERVYKLHKDADLGFVSFASQEARNADALRELALNRRLAPDVYLGIAPVERSGGRFRVAALVSHPRELPRGEHCVVMRRLPDGRDALRLLEAGHLTREQLGRLASRIARFHGEHGLGRPAPWSEAEWLERILAPVEANFTSLLERTPDVLPRESVRELRERAREAWTRLRPAFARRRSEGRAVDGHGDLHLDHVWFERDDAEPLVIDCIAFDEKLRRIDAASDVAFLGMDLGSRGRTDLAEHFFAAYALESDDYGLFDVVDFFMSYRAGVRAKVAALETLDRGIPARQRREAEGRAARRIDFAGRALAPRPPGRVTLVGGVIGGGKSTAARALALGVGAVIVSSDEVRRRLPQDARETPGPGWKRGRYSAAATARVYDGMLERAGCVVASGRDVLLDASWSSRARRELARRWAQARGARAHLIEIRCERATALERLAARQREGKDASEAGPDLYEEFVRSYEPPDEWPSRDRTVVETDREGWRERLLAEVADSRAADASA